MNFTSAGETSFSSAFSPLAKTAGTSAVSRAEPAAWRDNFTQAPLRQNSRLAPRLWTAEEVGVGLAYGLSSRQLTNQSAAWQMARKQPEIWTDAAANVDGEGTETATDTEGNGDTEAPAETASTDGSDETTSQDSTAAKGPDGEPLDDQELQLLNDLKSSDRDIRQHEQAHLSAAGGYARGGARFEYERGPDGNQYAVGGEVSIDSSSESTPEKTIQKMQVVQRAALAPREPSSQDRRVASQAKIRENEARQEQARQQAEQMTGQREARNAKTEEAARRRSDTEDAAADYEPDAAGLSSRREAGRAYARQGLDESWQPETRAMQPGTGIRNANLGLIPTLAPTPGSAADIGMLGAA